MVPVVPVSLNCFLHGLKLCAVIWKLPILDHMIECEVQEPWGWRAQTELGSWLMLFGCLLWLWLSLCSCVSQEGVSHTSAGIYQTSSLRTDLWPEVSRWSPGLSDIVLSSLALFHGWYGHRVGSSLWSPYIYVWCSALSSPTFWPGEVMNGPLLLPYISGL